MTTIVLFLELPDGRVAATDVEAASVAPANLNLWRRTPSLKPSKSVAGKGRFRIRARSR